MVQIHWFKSDRLKGYGIAQIRTTSGKSITEVYSSKSGALRKLAPRKTYRLNGYGYSEQYLLTVAANERAFNDMLDLDMRAPENPLYTGQSKHPALKDGYIMFDARQQSTARFFEPGTSIRTALDMFKEQGIDVAPEDIRLIHPVTCKQIPLTVRPVTTYEFIIG